MIEYPTQKRMYDWNAERNSPPKSKLPRKRFNNTPDHPRHSPLQLKLETIHRYFELDESIQLVSEEIGYGRSSIYSWRKKYILKGVAALINYDDPRGELPEGELSSSKEIEQLKSQIQEEKAVIIGALKNKYPLLILLQKLNLSRSSYYYQRKQLASSDKCVALRISHFRKDCPENHGRMRTECKIQTKD